MGIFGGNPLAGLFGGGGGGGDTSVSSGGIGNSKSQNDSRSYDASTNAGNDSTVNSSTTIIEGGTNTLGDYGAINAAMKLALAGVDAQSKTSQQVIASNAGLLEGALSNSATQQAQFASTIENIKTADVRVLIIAGLAAVGLVAFAALRKG